MDLLRLHFALANRNLQAAMPSAGTRNIQACSSRLAHKRTWILMVCAGCRLQCTGAAEMRKLYRCPMRRSALCRVHSAQLPGMRLVLEADHLCLSSAQSTLMHWVCWHVL